MKKYVIYFKGQASGKRGVFQKIIEAYDKVDARRYSGVWEPLIIKIVEL